MASRPRTDLQKALATLTSRAARDVRKVIESGASAEKIAEVLRAVMPAMIDKYGTAAAAVAADWYEETRAAAGVAGHFHTLVKDPAGGLTIKRTNGIVGAGVKHLFGESADPILAANIISGAMSTQILDSARQTVMASSVADPESQGWSRETDGDACDFCEVLATRGVSYSESSADFASHDFCGCSAVPEFGGESKDVQLNEDGTRATVSSRRDRTDAKQRAASNKRVRDWIAANPNKG